MPQEAVVNSSPLIGLYKIGDLNLLGALYRKVWVTSIVLEEISAGFNGPQLAGYLENQEWVGIRKFVASRWRVGGGEGLF